MSTELVDAMVLAILEQPLPGDRKTRDFSDVRTAETFYLQPQSSARAYSSCTAIYSHTQSIKSPYSLYTSLEAAHSIYPVRIQSMLTHRDVYTAYTSHIQPYTVHIQSIFVAHHLM